MVITVGAFLGVTRITSAGAANAKFKCQDRSNVGIVLDGNIPGNFAEFDLELTKDGKSVRMSSSGDNLFITNDFREDVFVLRVIRDQGAWLTLYGKRGTRKSKGGNGWDWFRIDAVLKTAPDPASDGRLQDVPMTCTYDYSI
jgi:hypothetical protein